MSQALYRKWRPQKWDQVIGQEHVVQTLRNAVIADRVAHAYLFPGPRGTGKTTTARLLAKAVNCLAEDRNKRPCDECNHCKAVNQGRFMDLIEIDAASNTSVDDVRDLREKINFSPTQGRYKVYIIDEVHMLSTAAFNALLKTLEEPPPHAIFVLATTEVHKIPATVLSRCQRHEFRRIPIEGIISQLEIIVQSENFKIDKDALRLIARQATGSMRDAISLLDQLAASRDHIGLKDAEEILGTATNQTVLDVVDAILARDPAIGLQVTHKALDAGTDPRQLARQIVEYVRDLLLVKVGSGSLVDVTGDIREKMVNHAQSLETPVLLHIIKIYSEAATQQRMTWQPGLPLELAFVKSISQSSESIIESKSPSTPLPQPQTNPRKPREKSVKKQSQIEQEDETNEPSESDVEDGLSLRNIEKQWRKILTKTREQNLSTQALLNSCKVIDLRGHDLYLGFASEVLKSKMEKEDHLLVVRQVIEQVFGQELHIRCVISTDDQSELPPDVDSDGMVATALRLGGEIVDSRDIKTKKKQ